MKTSPVLFNLVGLINGDGNTIVQSQTAFFVLFCMPPGCAEKIYIFRSLGRMEMFLVERGFSKATTKSIFHEKSPIPREAIGTLAGIQ